MNTNKLTEAQQTAIETLVREATLHIRKYGSVDPSVSFTVAINNAKSVGITEDEVTALINHARKHA